MVKRARCLFQLPVSFLNLLRNAFIAVFFATLKVVALAFTGFFGSLRFKGALVRPDCVVKIELLQLNVRVLAAVVVLVQL